MENNVVDIKTRRALFSDDVKDKIQEGLKPYMKDDLKYEAEVQIVNIVEQVLCVAVISGARSFAEKLAMNILNRLTGKKVQQPPSTEAENQTV